MPHMPVVEAVPNFSEGRRMEVVDAIVAALTEPQVMLLDRSSDAHHNRSVVTVAGSPEAVLQGLLQAVGVAATHIDLRQHQGQHPRMGATDVVPLVPIRNLDLTACAELARELGRRIGDELALPVYLYEAAATRPERRALPFVRRGGYEALVREIARPERTPDFGPSRVGPAGAVIVGARPFLIAFNVFLQTDDVQIGKEIARAIRESSGGLPAVRALGLLVGGQAQVSMNLVDFRRTPPHVALEAIRREAARRGTAVDRSELIGLIPEDAIVAAAGYCLQLPDFSGDRVLEAVLRQMEAAKA